MKYILDRYRPFQSKSNSFLKIEDNSSAEIFVIVYYSWCVVWLILLALGLTVAHLHTQHLSNGPKEKGLKGISFYIRVFVCFSLKISAIFKTRTMTFEHKDYFNTKKLHTRKIPEITIFTVFFGCFFHTQIQK